MLGARGLVLEYKLVTGWCRSGDADVERVGRELNDVHSFMNVPGTFMNVAAPSSVMFMNGT